MEGACSRPRRLTLVRPGGRTSIPTESRWRGRRSPVLAEHYTTTPHGDAPPVTASAINLRELAPLAQALDTFSIVYLQWLSNDVMWYARDQTFKQQLEVAEARMGVRPRRRWRQRFRRSLKDAAGDAVVRWASATLPKMAHARLSETLRILGAAARENARQTETAEVFRKLERELGKCRSAVEQVVARVAEGERAQIARAGEEISARVRRLFMEGDPPAPREPDAWTAIFRTASVRLSDAQARELNDRLEGIEAAKQLARLAQRVAELTHKADENRRPAVVAVWPPAARCGLALYRPVDLDKLAESNYLELKFSRDLHWTAFLTAIDLIENHARMLWRLLESQLTAAPLEARFQLMHRLAGEHALTGRHADQLRALSAPDAVFLTIEPDYDTHDDRSPRTPTRRPRTAAAAAPDRAGPDRALLASGCRRSIAAPPSSRSATRSRGNVWSACSRRWTRSASRLGTDAQQPSRIVQRLARCGSLLGDDILHGVSEQLAEIKSHDGRPVHLVMQMPRELMRYPWELLRDSSGWLVDRFAIGRQLIADMETVRRWSGCAPPGSPAPPGRRAEDRGPGRGAGWRRRARRRPRRRMLRAPAGAAARASSIRRTSAATSTSRSRSISSASCCASASTTWSTSPATAVSTPDIRNEAAGGSATATCTRSSCATRWRMRPSRRGWCTAARARARERPARRRAATTTACTAWPARHSGKGVAAYIGPLWRIPETDAKNLASVFYQALLLRRTSLGEALALARRLVREGRAGDDDAFAPVVGERCRGSAGHRPRAFGWLDRHCALRRSDADDPSTAEPVGGWGLRSGTSRP